MQALMRRGPGGAPATGTRSTVTLWLLACGILSSLLYVAMLAFVPLRWASYDSAARTVSELSAIDAPTRPLWVSLALIWTALYVAFGCGIWRVGENQRALRVAGALVVLCGVFGLFWPPMHQREVLAAGGGTLTDTLHIVWTIVNGILTLLAMGFAAAGLGKPFRRYSVVTMVVLVAAGGLSSLDAPGVDANLPTPWIGVWERTNMAAWLAWVLVLAVLLLHHARSSAIRGRSGRTRPVRTTDCAS